MKKKKGRRGVAPKSIVVGKSKKEHTHTEKRDTTTIQPPYKGEKMNASCVCVRMYVCAWSVCICVCRFVVAGDCHCKDIHTQKHTANKVSTKKETMTGKRCCGIVRGRARRGRGMDVFRPFFLMFFALLVLSQELLLLIDTKAAPNT